MRSLHNLVQLLRGQAQDAQLQAQRAAQQLQASQQQQNMKNINVMGPGMMGMGMMMPNMFAAQNMMAQNMMAQNLMAQNMMGAGAMGANPMFSSGAFGGMGGSMGIPSGMPPTGFMGMQKTAEEPNLKKEKDGGMPPAGLPADAEWDAARNGWWTPKQPPAQSSRRSSTASAVSTVVEEEEQDKKAVFSGLMAGLDKPKAKTMEAAPLPRSKTATTVGSRPPRFGNFGTRSQLSHRSFGGLPTPVEQVKTLLAGLDPKPDYSAEYQAAVKNLSGRRHLTRMRTDDELKGYLKVCFAGFEYLNLEHGLLCFPGDKADFGTLKTWNEEHGNALVCIRCSVLALPCTHTVPCGPCMEEGVDCQFSQCQLSPCNHGSQCRDAHEVFYDIMKTVYKRDKAEVNKKHLWKFPPGFENLKAALDRNGRVPSSATSPPAVKLMAMFRGTNFWAPKWMRNLWNPTLPANLLPVAKACEAKNSKEAYDAFIQKQMGKTVEVGSTVEAEKTVEAPAAGPSQPAPVAAAEKAVVQEVELRRVPQHFRKKWATVELFKANNYPQYRVAVMKQKEQDEARVTASHPANTWHKFSLDKANEESAEKFLESLKTPWQRDAEYKDLQRKRGVDIDDAGNARRITSEAGPKDREEEGELAENDDGKADLAPSEEGGQCGTAPFVSRLF